MFRKLLTPFTYIKKRIFLKFIHNYWYGWIIRLTRSLWYSSYVQNVAVKEKLAYPCDTESPRTSTWSRFRWEFLFTWPWSWDNYNTGWPWSGFKVRHRDWPGPLFHSFFTVKNEIKILISVVQYLVSTKIPKAIYAMFNTESGKTNIMFSLFSD